MTDWRFPGATKETEMKDRCPRCDSPAPRLHPAIQYEGEVAICRHPWHQATTTGWDKLGEFEEAILVPAVMSGSGHQPRPRRVTIRKGVALGRGKIPTSPPPPVPTTRPPDSGHQRGGSRTQHHQGDEMSARINFTPLTDAIILAASLPTYYAGSAGGEIRTAILRGYLVGARAAYGHILDSAEGL